MKRWTTVLIAVVLAATSIAAAQQAPQSEDERAALRSRIEDRFVVVPLADGVALRPKTPIPDVRLVEIGAGAVLINGAPVTGRELRDRLGADADLVLRLSYLGADERRQLFERKPEAQPPLEIQRPVETPIRRPERPSRLHRSGGDRVRIFGNLGIREDEEITGQAVAVLGSVRVDGEVGDQVVAVLGSVDLGPRAVVNGDVVSVGGRVRRAEGAQIRGSVTEVALTEPNIRINFEPLFAWPFVFADGFGALPRLVGSTFRFLLLVLFASIALVLARPTVEASAQRVADNPVKAVLVGLAAEVLLAPALILTGIVLAISIIGIPLLLLLPFVVLLLLLLALVGFTGTAYSVGQWVRRRVGVPNGPPFVDLVVGVLVILSPLMLGRIVALAGWPGAPVAILFLVTGFAVEFLAWSCGFGAVLTNAFPRWQARRASRTPVPPPAG